MSDENTKIRKVYLLFTSIPDPAPIRSKIFFLVNLLQGLKITYHEKNPCALSIYCFKLP